MNFEVVVNDFEGPIDALLSLIEKRKLPINDITLADITDDFIRFINGQPHQSLSDTTHFIFVAATLTLIKSKSLLPKLELTDEEEGDIAELKKRLALLQEYQTIAGMLKKQFSPQSQLFYARDRARQIVFSPHQSIKKKTLLEALQDVLNEKPIVVSKKKEVSIKLVVHLDEMMGSLEDRIKKTIKTDFNTFVKDHAGNVTDRKEMRVYQVVGFLAMLELVRNGIMSVLQTENFSSIEIEKI